MFLVVKNEEIRYVLETQRERKKRTGQRKNERKREKTRVRKKKENKSQIAKCERDESFPK